ncbi:MAG: hypothetical protein ILO34_06985 [Kiritimatiellae bacterium]|nr:hypothetical protein [Kiritimatiellia bacterium]
MKIFAAAAFALAAASLGAFEDEPDELNWDTLGGTVAGFDHFRVWCEENPEFKKELLALPPLGTLPEKPATARILPDDFADAKVKMWWKVEEDGGGKLLTCNAGHDAVSGSTRTGIDIPADGLYRIWARYWHEQGGHASFGFELCDGRFADETDFSLQTIEDVFYWRFDFAEYVRRANPPPTRKDEPSGWVWESTPLVRLERGRKTLTVSGIVHEGPYNSRKIAEFVLTEDPFFMPGGANLEGDGVRELWVRRPQICEGNAAHRKLWRRWKKKFVSDLAAGAVAGVEAGRMAYMAFYDEETNLVGSPIEVVAEKKRMKDFFAGLDRTSFVKKIEGEDFIPGVPGWEIEYITGTSNGRVVRSNYGGDECDASCLFEVPSNGTYAVWMRYMETGEHLAPFRLLVETPGGETLAEKTFLDNNDNGHGYGGWIWESLEVPLEAGRSRLRLHKNGRGKAYRRVDCFVVTGKKGCDPGEIGTVVAPYDGSKPLTVWKQDETWNGYDRLSAPKPGESLAPATVSLREGEVGQIQLLVRNNTKETLEATPEISGEGAAFTRWRVPAYIQDGGGEWCAMPLFERDDLFVPGEETAGVWLTIDGRKEGFRSCETSVVVGGERFVLSIVREEPLPASVPRPLVLGWASPYRTVSCWEMFKDIGINAINETAVPKADAVKYGIRLNLRFNDANVAPEHVREVVGRYKALGYDYEDWGWSFMDEPPAGEIDKWLECAYAMKEIDENVKIWVNPGEGSIEYAACCLNIVDCADYYCPAIQHFATDGWRNEIYNDMIHRRDPEVSFDILMSYSTPCFAEKAPSAPLDYLGMGAFAAGAGLDGWGFFALAYGFTYSNSLWDEKNAYYGDQCVNIYPGAAGRTISTRNAEAIREAVAVYRRALAEKGKEK